MAFIDHLNKLVRENLNEMVRRARDPIKALNLYIDDAAKTLDVMRQLVTDVVAQQKLVEAQRNQAAELAFEWERKAVAAHSSGSKDLARDCAARKFDYERQAKQYDSQAVSLQPRVEQVRKYQHLLELQYQSAARERDSLVQRRDIAKKQQKIGKGIADLRIGDPTGALEQARYATMKDEAAGAAALEQLEGVPMQLLELEHMNPEVDAWLRTLDAPADSNPQVDAWLRSLDQQDSATPLRARSVSIRKEP